MKTVFPNVEDGSKIASSLPLASVSATPSAPSFQSTIPTNGMTLSPKSASAAARAAKLAAKPKPRPSDNQPRPGALSLLERVQRKWQMASCVHFLDVFKEVIPLREVSADTADSLTPLVLETAIAQPDQNTGACLMLRDVIEALLVGLGAASPKGIAKSWFLSLRVFVDMHASDFMDCFEDHENVLKHYDNGLDFLVSVSWDIRLGLLLGLCNSAAEGAKCVRDYIRDAEAPAGRHAASELEDREVRLIAFGRCSRQRSFYKVGATRIYSGFKRKGPGTLMTECSDSVGMKELAESLETSSHSRDHLLAFEIRSKHLGPLQEVEERMARRTEKRRLEQIAREETRRRNAKRPRREKAAYV